MALENPPTSASELTSLPSMGWMRFARDLFDVSIEQICILSGIQRMESEAEELRELHAPNTTENGSKCMLANSASLLMALQTHKSIGFGGEVAPNLSAISDVEGIQAGRTATSLAVREREEGLTGTGGCRASTPVRGRFEREPPGSSLRVCRDPVSGSDVVSAVLDSAAEGEEASPYSIGTSSMSDPKSICSGAAVA
ncbi:hypothetical protein PPTG_21274 [Phytophthora nicotianae INRA-310]|uniref:Uncharacterized protein n=1 Tax=Phytophthora nicotianae (strain INRA-310) TaxID=761204 RepID=W2R4N9_PHYN3|nr:hypothetical protein PPTG_21274 [Phytophthora nicotianae INRA-310]ETN20318.1 hypothetical protein PPTG_21274 [Phytophthora nicotianae INRA-310]